MAMTFLQMANAAMEKAQAVDAADAINILTDNPDALLVDVRDEAEVFVTGIGNRAINAPGRSIAWKADAEPDNEWREPELQDRGRKILTTCGMSPCYRGAKAANLLTKMGFTDVSYVEGGMTALLDAGMPVVAPGKDTQAEEIGKRQLSA